MRSKGGSPTSPSYGNFVEFENINDDNCGICYDDLKKQETIAKNGIVYQLSCGHQFHNNCLNRWCVEKVKRLIMMLSAMEKKKGLLLILSVQYVIKKHLERNKIVRLQKLYIQ